MKSHWKVLSLNEMYSKMSVNCEPSCSGLNVVVTLELCIHTINILGCVFRCSDWCLSILWASYQIRKLWVAHAPGLPGTFSPPPTSKETASYPGMHHGTCATNVPWCMSGSLTRGGGENVPGIPGACATRNFTYLARSPWVDYSLDLMGASPRTILMIPEYFHFKL